MGAPNQEGRYRLESAFETRVTAMFGDGIVMGVREADENIEADTIEIQWRGETWLFVFVSERGVELIKKADHAPEDGNERHTEALTTSDPEAVSAFCQLLVNPFVTANPPMYV